VVVIGAGPAGLGAAHQLTKLGAEVSGLDYSITSVQLSLMIRQMFRETHHTTISIHVIHIHELITALVRLYAQQWLVSLCPVCLTDGMWH